MKPYIVNNQMFPHYDILTEYDGIYRYAAGFGRAWIILIPSPSGRITKRYPFYDGDAWGFGDGYNHGMMPPRYPVPTLR